MFIVIEPAEHNNYKKLIKPFLDHIKNNPRLKWSFQDYKKATFIISSDESKGIYGGAILLKQTDVALHKSFQKNIPNPKSHEGVWMCNFFFRKNNFFSQQTNFFFETFYRDLYKRLVEFGIKENTNFLYTMLEPGDHLCTKALGCWPYAFEIKSHESLSGLWHGILSLTNNPLQFQTRSGATMGCEEIKLAA